MLVFVIYFIGLFSHQANSLDISNLTPSSLPQDNELHPNVNFGEVVPRNKIAFRARIEAHYEGKIVKCGGSLIAPSWVLTAAHCVQKDPIKLIVTLGAYNLSDDEETERQVTEKNNKIFIYDNYNETTHENDIALIKLGRKYVKHAYVKSVDICRGNESFAGERGAVLGWGLKAQNVSEIPRLFDVIIIANNACRSINGRKIKVEDSQICTYRCWSGSCDWDVGGVLILKKGRGTRREQLGMVSFEKRNCDQYKVPIFTRITSFIPWIDAVIEAEGRTSGKSKSNLTQEIKWTSRSFATTANMWLLVLLTFSEININL